jgi:hypothetical protein
MIEKMRAVREDVGGLVCNLYVLRSWTRGQSCVYD